VKLTLNEKQAEVLVRALDLFSRIGVGQIKEVQNVLSLYLTKGRANDKAIALVDTDRVCQLLDEIAKEYGHPRGSHWSILSDQINDDFRVAYDIQQVVRNYLAWKLNPNGGMQVDFYDPKKTSRTQELPKID
jgi:hypothetical protein